MPTSGISANNIDAQHFQHEIERLNREVSQAYDEMVKGWSQALNIRDHETEKHSLRTTELATRLGQEMGLAGSSLEDLKRGAQLHDIGKMGIPDSILLKPSSLNDAEWTVMRKHPELGYEMLKGITYLQAAADVVRYHHEKWDGTGYLQGLKGEEIPLLARIFAIVEVYDSLCSDVPYRPAWPKERILRHIQDQSGKAFDPQVVEALHRLLNKA